jgi:serine protease Do
MGIVSAKNRLLGGSIIDYEDFIQTDAAINQGNSGGPLFNFDGQVIGVNSAILNPAVAMNVGFAIPINLAMQIARQLLTTGQVRRGLLGVTTDDLPEELARQLGIASGAIVNHVEPGGPADRAGLRANDVIVEIAGRRVDNKARVKQVIAARAPGDAVTIAFLRGGRRSEARAVLADNPTIASSGTKVLGMWVRELSARERSELGLREQYTAFRVLTVEPRGFASDALAANDVIIAIDRKGVTLAALEQLEQRLRRGGTGRLIIQRGGEPFMVELR